MKTSEKGSISGVVVCLAMSLVAVIGLTVEGGVAVRTYGELASMSASAARIGGQEISGIQSGHIHIDERRAAHAMTQFLRAHGEIGEFEIQGVNVSVTVRRIVKTQFLKFFGVSSRTVIVTRSVTVVKG